MELKKLQYLESVYRLQSFTKAAEELYVSQPAITSAIKSLEDELGVTLITRYHHKFQFTKEGELFVKHVYTILNDVEQARLEMKDISDHSEQILKLGLSNTVGYWLFPLIYSEFLPRFSHGRAFIEELALFNMIAAVEERTIDLAYTVIPENLNQELLTAIPVMTGELCLIMPKGHPLSKYEHIPFSKLNGEKIFTYHEKTYVQYRLKELCKQYSVTLNMIPGSKQVAAILYMVEKGAGLGFITYDSHTCYIDSTKLDIRGFEEPVRFQEGFILNRNQYRTRIVREFIRYVTEKAQSNIQ